jgi:hypothetical protein
VCEPYRRSPRRDYGRRELSCPAPVSAFVRYLFLVACVACGAPHTTAPAVVSLPSIPHRSVVATVPTPQAPPARVVVTGAPYGGLALWRASATGRIERVPFPWAELSVIDTLAVSPDGRDVAYVEGGSAFGPLLVRALADGSKTVVAAHAPGRELRVVAWSPDGRKLLWAARRAGSVRPDCHWSGCPRPGPSSYFVFDRERGRSVKTDGPGQLGQLGQLAAWLAGGALIVADDDGALARTKTNTPVAVGPYRHDDFSLDVAGNRLLSTGWDDGRKRDEVLALDLATWKETPLAPPAPYATYHWPSASPSGRRVAWLATSFAHHGIPEALVVDGKTLVAPTRDLVGFAWIDDRALVAHYADRLDVIDASDGTVKGSKTTGAQDTMR